jgi:hypothetical protein
MESDAFRPSLPCRILIRLGIFCGKSVFPIGFVVSRSKSEHSRLSRSVLRQLYLLLIRVLYYGSTITGGLNVIRHPTELAEWSPMLSDLVLY